MNENAISFIVDHLWQSTVFAFFAALLIIAFRKAPPWSRHFIAWAALLKFFVPIAAINQAIDFSSLSTEPASANVSDSTILIKAVSLGLDIDYWTSQFSEANATPKKTAAFPWATTSITLWISTALCAATFRWIRHWRRRQAIDRNAIPADETWTNLTREIANGRKFPRLAIDTSNQLNAGLFGIFRSVIVIPRKMDTEFDSQDREVFLRHELSHAFKRDNLWLFAQKCIRDVFWFHPLVCWLDRQISWEREMMRDEEVIHETKNTKSYLNCLMKASKLDLPRESSASLALNGSPFARRVKAIANNNFNRWSRLASATLSIVCACLLTVLLSVSVTQLQAQETGRKTDGQINEVLEESLQNARQKLAEGNIKLQPKLSDSEQPIFKELMALLKTDKDAAKKLLLENTNDNSSGAFNFMLGSIYGERDEKEKAREQFEIAIEKFPNFLRAIRNSGIMAVQQQDFETGKKRLVRAYELQEKPDSTTCGLIGLCYVNLGEYATAEYYYRQAVDLDPNVRDWQLGLVKSLLNQNKYEQAIPIMEGIKVANNKPRF